MSSTSAAGNSVVTALVSFLRHEADLADQNAQRLRDQADQLAEEYGVSSEMQDEYEMDPDEMPPLDENGIPKYRGKKRGRKPKKRKRKLNPQRVKRQHTAYTLFVQTNYPSVRALHPELPSKNVISMVARQWANVSASEKLVWKQRAIATHEAAASDTSNATATLSTTATSAAAANRSAAASTNQHGISPEDVLAAGVEAGVVDPDDVDVEDDEDDEDDGDGDDQQEEEDDDDDDDPVDGQEDNDGDDDDDHEDTRLQQAQVDDKQEEGMDDDGDVGQQEALPFATAAAASSSRGKQQKVAPSRGRGRDKNV